MGPVYGPVILLLLFAGRASVCPAADATVPGELKSDPPTLRCLGFRWYIEGDDNGNGRASMAYRSKGAAEWREALPLLRVNREVVDRAGKGKYTCDNLFAGSVFGLDPDTEYEVRIELTDPDGGKADKTLTVRTRAVPVAPEPLRTLHLYPPGYEGRKGAPAFDALETAIVELRPGDLLLVHQGVHSGGVRFALSGTAHHPIVIRGADGPSVIQAPDGSSHNFHVHGLKHLFIENLTLKGGYTGISAYGTSFLTVRGCRILGVESGIANDRRASQGWYIADNVLIGGNPQHWHPRRKRPCEAGIEYYGRGHVICHNRVEKFWDCIANADIGPAKDRGLKVVAIDIYNNDLSQATDDCLETDFGCHNIRVWANRFRDGYVGISCQPIYGGPVYLIRNEMYGLTETPYKLHNWPSGIYILHNISVTGYQGFDSAPIWQNATVCNNLYLGAQRYAMETGSPDKRTTLDYNGYRRTSDPERFIRWKDWKGNNPRYASLAEFTRGTGHEKHGIMVDFDVFKKCPPPKRGGAHKPEDYDLRLKEGGRPIDAGVRLPNINDGFTGKAPDIGCYEFGEPPPHYGPRE